VYVRPILEYSSVAWNPYLIKDIKALKSVQRRFTKMLPDTEKLTYQRLRILQLDSLELRRVRADLLFTYKLVFGLIDASLHDFLYHASTKLDEVSPPTAVSQWPINCTFQPAKQDLIASTTESYKNGTHSQIASILHHLKYFINLWPLKCYFHIARYFYLVGCAAYRQYMFCILYSCVFGTIFLHCIHACQCKWPIGPFVQ